MAVEELTGSVDAIVGLQRGDEAKGRFVDMWMEEGYDNVARYGGGPNAGHTVVTPDGRTLKMHTIPSGIAHSGKKSVIGDGVFVDAGKLVAEIDYLHGQDIEVSPRNLLISSSAPLILPHHVLRDEIREAGSGGQGSTKSGISGVAADLALREGVRAEAINNDQDDLFKRIIEGLLNTDSDFATSEAYDIAERYVEQAQKLGAYITDTMLFLNDELDAGRDILAEGAQGFLLDMYQGMSPYTTSSITTSGGIAPGLGVPPQSIRKVLGVAKAVQSHVGGGHFVTEFKDPGLIDRMHGDLTAPDAERGTTTDRKRDLGYLDIPQIRRANMANGTTEMAVAKIDWLSRYVDVIPVCTAYARKGKTLKVAPNAEYKLRQSEPIYEELPGWTEDVSDVREFSDLPPNAQRYIEFVESKTGVPITLIGVGQRRDQVIVRKAA